MKKIYYLIHSKSFGDTLAATPVLRYLSHSHEQKINVVTYNSHIFENNIYTERCLSFEEFYQLKEGEIIRYESFTFAGRKDNNGIEKKFSHMDTRQVHAMDLGFQLMPHQMEYDYAPNFVELEYDLPEKYVVCHTTQNWPNRTWDTEKWQNLINWLSSNRIFTVLIGKDHSEKVHDSISKDPLLKSCPKLDNLYGLDLCNKIGLNEMYQIIKGGSCLVTMDTGPLHIAGCTDTHILQIGTARNPILSAPYRNNSYGYRYDFVGGECNIFCNSNLKYNIKEWGDINSVAPLTGCSENKLTFECHPTSDSVISKLNDIIGEEEITKSRIGQVEEDQKKQIKFGVYTSFYNSENFIEQAFDNIEKINYENFEWHVTDDYSSDSTKKILLDRINTSSIKGKIKYYEQSSKKEMFWKPNLFFDDSFEWIILVDSDDLVDPECLNVYNGVLKDKDDVSLISSDFHKVIHDSGNLHSISYILNDEILSNKVDRYHPSCDYLNNISYSCFGTLRGFNHKKISSFEIKNNLAGGEDSYHVLWSNSYGKYLHVPRPLYIWSLRDNSESHSIGVSPVFNDNFDMALKKLKANDGGVDISFNDVYIESCALGSYTVGELKNKNASLWSKPLSDTQEEKLRLLYPDTNLSFSDKNSEVNIVCLNAFDNKELDIVMNEISSSKILLYYQNQKNHDDNTEKDSELMNQLEYYKEVLDKHIAYSWWMYIRHFVIKN